MAPPLLSVAHTMTSRAVALLFAVAGCVDGAEPDEGTLGEGKADGPSEFTLALNRTAAGVQRAKESPKLPGAPASTMKFTCPVDDRTDGGWRLLCERGDERLDLTFGPGELEGAAIYRKSVAARDSRSFYRCEAAAAAPDAWPAELRCVARQPASIVNGQMVSPFASTLDLGIANSHLVAQHPSGAKLFRGMKPFRPADFEELASLDVGAVLIFKRPTSSTEVAKELAALTPIGVPESHVLNIPFGFKDFTDFAEPCRQTVRGLAQLEAWASAGTHAFVHCTVGEDRTGYLAGLHRLLREPLPVEAMFEQELCERGYSSGNPQKPIRGVAGEIDADLTPLFLKMAFKISRGELTPTSLDERVCDVDPATDPAFSGPTWEPEGYRCLVSTRYRL